MKSAVFLRRKTVLASVLACALLAPAVHAWTKTETPAPAIVARTPPTPLLWKVSDKDNSIYLLGSFHLLKTDDYPLSSDIDTAFEDPRHWSSKFRRRSCPIRRWARR